MAIESIVEKLIIPKIDNIIALCKGKYDEYMIPKAEHFQEYLERTYEKYSIINTLVFHNTQRQLKDIYIAQTLVNKYVSDREFRSIKIDKIPVELIKEYKKILITDTAGMGKSTIMKRMFIDLIDRGMESVGIPIYIELNRLKRERTILMEVHEELSSLTKEFDEDLYLKLIQTGGFIFFLDGFDEISILDKNDVIHDIQSFISKAGTKNYYIMTSRHEDSLRSFGDFQSFSIQPLTKDEAFELLRKYDLSRYKQLSKKLIQLLECGEYDSIDEYLENPLLVSLLYSAFDHKQTIPLKKHQFYRQVYDAYFDTHDLTKGIDARQKRSGLDIDDFNRVLRYVGYECLMRIGVRFDEDTIIKSIDRARVFCLNLKFSSTDFLQDLLIAVPLFSKEGTEYKWAHKSLMEYFAAQFIFFDAKLNQDRILKKISQSEHVDKFINMLDLYYDIDWKGFSQSITLPICKGYVEFYAKHNTTVLGVNKDLIDERLAYLFFGRYAFVIKPDSDLGIEVPWELPNLGFSAEDIESYKYGSDDTFSFAKSFYYQESLFILLNKKIHYIFNKTSNYVDVIGLLRRLYVYYENSFMQNYAYLIDVKTGSEKAFLYDAVNQLIKRFRGLYLNCEACKKEVEHIEKEIAQSEDVFDVLASI
jgi:hypothetical protein